MINLIHVNRLDLLGQMPPWEFVIPEQVVKEVSDRAQACILAEAIAKGILRTDTSTNPAELQLYADLEQTMGRGEAACPAMAQARHCIIACDEKGRFLDEALSRLGKACILNTPGLPLRGSCAKMVSCNFPFPTRQMQDPSTPAIGSILEL
jgi:hypothetical protein